MELGVVATDHWEDLSSQLVKGTEKRLPDLWKRSAKTLGTENQIYMAKKSAKDRPPSQEFHMINHSSTLP